MDQQPYQVSSVTSFADRIDTPLRTPGCILLYCTEGRAIVECNFRTVPFRKGGMIIVFSDTLFSMKKISPGFTTRHFELSAALTDETTFTAAGAFFDWLYEHPVFMIPAEKEADMQTWLSVMDWIEGNTDGKHRKIMLRNHWHNFFLGLESVLKHRLTDNDVKPISSSRKIFDGFCRLLCENCRKHHEVRFYADKLCITPYYLSRITHRIFAVSPKELIDRQIMMEIKSLLTTTELTVKEISDMYGFESSSYLGRFFRRNIGMTPTEYRNQHNRLF